MDKSPTRVSDDVISAASSSSTPASPLSSCLRNRHKNRDNLSNRSVSFPEDENRIVTGYLEPVNPWLYAESTTKEAVLSNYIRSCEKHCVHPLRSVVVQLEGLPYNEGNERYDSFDLRYETLALGCCEALEEVFKRVQFERLNLDNTGLDDEASVALFDMIEYYEAATSLNISNNSKIGSLGWQACSRMLKRTKCLEQLECRNTPLDEILIPPLSRALRVGTQLQVLKLEKCSLAGRPIVILAAALKLNTTLKELYLAENEFTANDAVQISGLLKCNVTLQLLDLSNNALADSGVSHLCDALCEQTRPSGGLGILVLWNNHLTSTSATHFGRALKINNTLEMLNIGHNELKDDFLTGLYEGVTLNRNLLRLGMQTTHLTSAGATTLAQIMNANPNLQRIDLRDNDLQPSGLASLSLALKSNTSITQLDIDDSPKNLKGEDSTEDYIVFVEEIRNYCQRNECIESADSSEEDIALRANLSSIAARKISLTCDTSMMSRPPLQSTPAVVSSSFLQVDSRKLGSSGRLRSPAPSPIPSPVASPSPTRTRFHVSKVSEESPTDLEFFGGRNMRFRVTPVNSIDLPNARCPATSIAIPQVVVTPRPPAPASPTTTIKKLPPPTNPTPESTPPRSRKLSSWMSPIFPESKVTSAGIEKLLGLFQNPFGIRGGGGPQNDELTDCSSGGGGALRRGDSTNNNDAARTSIIVSQMSSSDDVAQDEKESESGATWPQASLLRSPTSSPIQGATSTPSISAAMTVVKPTG